MGQPSRSLVRGVDAFSGRDSEDSQQQEEGEPADGVRAAVPKYMTPQSMSFDLFRKVLEIVHQHEVTRSWKSLKTVVHLVHSILKSTRSTAGIKES